MDSQNRTVWVDRVVAFVDILGFKDLLKEMEGNSSVFQTVSNALRHLLDTENTLTAHEHTTEMTTFSDCTVLSVAPSSEFFLLDLVRYLSITLLRRGILFRGAIITAPLFHEGRIVFGPA